MLSESILLHRMGNTANSSNKLISEAIDELRVRLPSGWRTDVECESTKADRGYDALLTLCASDGTCGAFVLQAKNRIEPRDALRIADQLASHSLPHNDRPVTPVLLAPFLSSRTRERLEERGISYVDLTGNIRIVADRPALFVQSSGARRDPRREERSARSLKGAKAGRLVRALCDFSPPTGVRQLAGLTGTDPGYASRVLAFLEAEALVEREPRGPVTGTDWPALLRRWSEDYSVTESNVSHAYLEPRGTSALLGKLRDAGFRYALTGSLGASQLAPVAPARLAMVYADDPEEAADALGLRPAERGANALLLSPFDEVVYERAWDRDGLVFCAPSQLTVDLLTGLGRSPAEGEELVRWMEENEGAWRERAS